MMMEDKGDMALPSERAGGRCPEPAAQSQPTALIPSADDYAIAERGNIEWGRAVNGPHVAVIAAQMARQDGYFRGLAAAAEIAKAHRPSRVIRGVPLSRYDIEDREIIRAEENGEAIAAECIAFAISREMDRANG